jgi:hypothetical protein
MEHIKHAGRQLKWIVAALLILSPLIYIAVFVWQGPSALLQIPKSVSINLEEASTLNNIVLFLIPALTPLIYWSAFYFLYDLASQYAKGTVFTLIAVKRLRLIGILLLLTDFIYMFQVAITGPVLTGLGLADGFLSLELKLGTSVIGLFIVLISRVMVIASELDAQQRLTI